MDKLTTLDKCAYLDKHDPVNKLGPLDHFMGGGRRGGTLCADNEVKALEY